MWVTNILHNKIKINLFSSAMRAIRFLIWTSQKAANKPCLFKTWNLI